MIKIEWITKRNGFTEGCLCLYINNDCPDDSKLFRITKLDQVKLIDHPSTVSPRKLVEVRTRAGVYDNPYYLELTGELYPIESKQWSIWNTGNPEMGAYQGVAISDTGNLRTVTAMLRMDGHTMSNNGRYELIDRPEWAPGFKL